MSKVPHIPKGYNSVTPYLIIKGAAQAIEYYKKVFGATEVMRMNGPDGKVAHAELKIGDSRFMLADENPGMGQGYASAATIGASPVSLYLYVPDVDKIVRTCRRRGSQNPQAGAGPVLRRSLGLHSGSVRPSLGSRHARGRRVSAGNGTTHEEGDASRLTMAALSYWLLALGPTEVGFGSRLRANG